MFVWLYFSPYNEQLLQRFYRTWAGLLQSKDSACQNNCSFIQKKKEDEWFHKYTRQTAHTLSAIQAVSHTQTHTSTHHNIQSKKEGWVLRGVGGLSLGIFFDWYFWVQGFDVPASVGCKTSGSTDRKPYEFLVVVRANAIIFVYILKL